MSAETGRHVWAVWWRLRYPCGWTEWERCMADYSRPDLLPTKYWLTMTFATRRLARNFTLASRRARHSSKMQFRVVKMQAVNPKEEPIE